MCRWRRSAGASYCWQSRLMLVALSPARLKRLRQLLKQLESWGVKSVELREKVEKRRAAAGDESFRWSAFAPARVHSWGTVGSMGPG